MHRRSRVPRIASLIVILSLSLSLSLPLVAQPIRAQSGYTPTVEWADCPFPLPENELDSGTIECGYLIVPQQRIDPDGVEVELAFAILYATGPNPAPDPLVYLEGGPGGSGLSGVDAWYDSPLRRDRDIIVLDQRGTGYSYPFLGCFELAELEDESGEQEALQACADRLRAEDGVDLSAYTSAHNAADVADLRIALGYDEWNLFGVSYGTRLALTVMRDHPQGVRSVILDSAYPPVVDAYEELAYNTQRVFDMMFNDCAADAACGAAYPDLQRRFYALVDRLNESPTAIEELEMDLTGNDLVEIVFQWLYVTDYIPYIPMALHDLDQGRPATLVMLEDGVLPGQVLEDDDRVFQFVDEVYWLIEEESDDVYGAFFDDAYYRIAEDSDYDGFVDLIFDTFDEEDAEYLVELLEQMDDYDLYRLSYDLFYDDRSDADGMFNSVECNEETPFNSYDEALAFSANVPTQLRDTSLIDFEDMIAICNVWDSGAADPIEDLAVTSDIPTFIAAGQYDPITPPEWGLITALTLSRNVYFEYPAVGHSVIDGGPCPVSMMAAFLNTPTRAPDAGCIAGM